ncbi:GNAT family N-acetyltransferase [Nocardioides sp. GXZ039]|uniref:GNAT family N-acetyltransferase n=1 Tax=Nocardioides sp. GXZ039 TaxID=3136018 RepID=UPI0030F3B71C
MPTPLPPELVVAEADAALDQRLSDELDRFNLAALPGPEAVELTVRADDGAGELCGGVSGWTWHEAAGIGMTWVREDQRGSGLGALLLARFEQAAAERGARRVFVTSFTFQAPGFYERHGYREIFRWEGVPVAGTDDVHFRKDL